MSLHSKQSPVIRDLSLHRESARTTGSNVQLLVQQYSSTTCTIDRVRNPIFVRTTVCEM